MKNDKTKLFFLITVSGIVVFFLVNYFVMKPKSESNYNPAETTLNSPTNNGTKQNLLRDQFGIKEIYPTADGGRIWFDSWIGKARMINAVGQDPFDSDFFAHGKGSVSIDGQGVASIQGESPRMYVYDAAQKEKWNNVEVTVYGKRVSEAGVKNSQGIVIGARSDHQNNDDDHPCLAATYYGRLLYDGRAVFQKEIIHTTSYNIYSANKPDENHKVSWDSPSGTMPIGLWIGVKLVVVTNPDGKSVKLELYRDLTGGKDGGNWEKVAEYVDDGNWPQTNSSADIVKICGYASNKVLLDPGSAVFIRNDSVNSAKYKWFSVREIGLL